MDDDPLVALITAGQTMFPDFEFFAPEGILTIRRSAEAVDRLRVELPPGQFLHLQSIGVTAENVDDVTPIASVEVSSWYAAYGEKFETHRLFDWDSPSGTVLHTQADDPAWTEVTFDYPIDVTEIKLRNVKGAICERARNLRVSMRSAGHWVTVYDGADRGLRLEALMTQLQEHSPRPVDHEISLLTPVVGATIAGRYPEARRTFDALPLSPAVAKHFKSEISRQLLAARGLEWTIHGPQRCFRFWTKRERLLYIQMAATIANELKELTPHVCFGFGGALAVVRDGGLIPHDDDLDLIIGFDPHEAATLPEALKLIETFLRPRGIQVTGNFSAHRHVKMPGKKHVDVFAGLFEGDTISWYPGKRGVLTRQIMFPTSEGLLYGVPVPLPRSPLIYLERIYGAGWRQPNPDFKHTWNRSAYADLQQRNRPDPEQAAPD